MPKNAQLMPGAASSTKYRRILTLSAALLILSAEVSYAASATLLTSSLCVDPGDAVNYYWSKEKHGAAALFFMKNDGGIVKLTPASNGFDTYDKIYIAAHGSEGSITPFLIDDFINYFHAEHPSTPGLLYFESCEAAKGSPSNMKKFNTKYGDMVGKLEGPVGSCQMVGNGSPDLVASVYRYDAEQSNPILFDQIVSNIENEWKNGNYNNTGVSYADTCNMLMTSFDASALLTFIQKSFDHFTNAPTVPIENSYNYRELVALNKNGAEFLTCGVDEAKPCP